MKIIAMICAVGLQVVGSITLYAIDRSPFEKQVRENIEATKSADANERYHGVERLGLMRAYASGGKIAECLGDSDPKVRMQTAQSLSTCGGREQIPALIKTLRDEGWTVRQAAAVALGNISGQDISFDTTATQTKREQQIIVWKQWYDSLKADVVPASLRAAAMIPKGEQPLRRSLEQTVENERRLKLIRALGAMRGKGASQLIIQQLEQSRRENPNATKIIVQSWQSRERRNPLQVHISCMQAGLRALSRLKEDDGYDFTLKELLSQDTYFIRFAADALGEFGRKEAVEHLIITFAKRQKSKDNSYFPKRKDQASGGQESINDTAFFIMGAMSRLPFSDKNKEALKEHAHIILDNLPLFHDNLFTYKQDVAYIYAEKLFEKIGYKDQLAEHMLATALGKPVPKHDFNKPLIQVFNKKGKGGTPISWACNDPKYTERLHQILDEAKDPVHRIMAVKALVLLKDPKVAKHVARLLKASRTEADYGYNPIWRMEEYNDPAIRWRAEFARVLGYIGTGKQVPLLIKLMNDERNVQEVRFRATQALGRMGHPNGLKALQIAAVEHQMHSVKTYARDYLRRNDMTWESYSGDGAEPLKPTTVSRKRGELPPAIVYIEGDMVIPGYAFMDPWRQIHGFTDSGPTYRAGRNLKVLSPVTPDGIVRDLTTFKDGWVSGCEVSYDGTKVIFSHRSGTSPWWHIYEINTDGTNLHQITKGPYHDVMPNYLPSGKIIFSSTRVGYRDEYHGYATTGLHVMNLDGTDIECIGINVGRDCDPAVFPDGRIGFSRTDIMYSNLKVETVPYSIFSDGTGLKNLYGPRRRAFWSDLMLNKRRQNWLWSPMAFYNSLAFSQPQPLGTGGDFIMSSVFGIVKPSFDQESEEFLFDRKWAITSQFPLDESRFLCAASERVDGDVGKMITYKKWNLGGTPLDSPVLRKFRPDTAEYTEEKARELNADLGLYVMDTKTRKLTLIHRKEGKAFFEPRPIWSRSIPPVNSVRYNRREATGKLMCMSAFTSDDTRLKRRAKWVRIIRGTPYGTRHHNNMGMTTRFKHYFANHFWKNHVGTHSRVLGTYPLAPDGSFNFSVPADQHLQCLLLDADMMVVGSELIWQYVRPGENKSCVGCHEKSTSTPVSGKYPYAMRQPSISVMPDKGQFSYNASVYRRFDNLHLDTTDESIWYSQSYDTICRP